MKQWMKGRLLYYIAGALLILAYSLLWFLDTPAGFQLLRYLGGAILVVGISLIFLPRFAFRSKGKPGKGSDWTETTIIVDTGIYSVVRHPLYLGWLLIYAALILLNQQWLTAIIGIPGTVLVLVFLVMTLITPNLWMN